MPEYPSLSVPVFLTEPGCLPIPAFLMRQECPPVLAFLMKPECLTIPVFLTVLAPESQSGTVPESPALSRQDLR